MSSKIENKNEEDVLSSENKVKKTRRRRDGSSSPAKQLRLYFNSDTQNALVEYQNYGVENKRERELVYITRIFPAFEKLVENLINIHKFSGLHDSYDDLKKDCINFLFETIHKFDASRGTNAFSYFNVVAKNWLIIKTKQKAMKLKKNVSMEDVTTLSPRDVSLIEEWGVIETPSIEGENENSINIEFLLKFLNEVKEKTRSENEKSCINAIIVIFKNIENIDLLNKSAVLLYIRELSGLNPKQLTMTMQTVKKYYRKIRHDFKNRAA